MTGVTTGVGYLHLGCIGIKEVTNLVGFDKGFFIPRGLFTTLKNQIGNKRRLAVDKIEYQILKNQIFYLIFLRSFPEKLLKLGTNPISAPAL